jgi:23S rRNA G2445 N2-methylase RlmL
MAEAYPRIGVDGFDLDEAVVTLARRHAKEAGVGDRVSFTVADASDLPGFGPV